MFDRPVLIAGVGLIIVVIAIGLTVLPPAPSPNGEAEPEPAATSALSSSADTAQVADESKGPTPVPASPAPSFDVVRTTAEGHAVIAGRAAPESTVVVRDGETVIGTTKADRRGEWILVPDEPLAAGSHQLAIDMTSDDGVAATSDDEVVIFIPRAGGDQSAISERAFPTSQEPLSVRVSRSGDHPPQVLQRPGGMAIEAGVVIDTVSYDDSGGFIVTGRSAPNADVRVLLDGAIAGSAVADAAGAWDVSTENLVTPGEHQVTAQHLNATGSIEATATRTFYRIGPMAESYDRQPGTVSYSRRAATQHIEIVTGHNLWRIAQRVYGRGVAYTLIYDANKDQIANPDLIYPGQIFTLPPSN